MDAETQINKLVQKSLLYITEEQRRRTFKKWVFSEKQPCSAVKMAEAGFIFIGNKDSPDTVKCFLCEKTLDGWEPTDDPWREHLDHSSNCLFAKLQKPTDLLTLNNILDMKEQLFKKAVNKYYDKVMEIVEEKFVELEKQIEKQLNQL